MEGVTGFYTGWQEAAVTTGSLAKGRILIPCLACTARIHMFIIPVRAISPFRPQIALYNERNIHVFNALDTSPIWGEIREVGQYSSIAWIPGNLLNEGTMIASVFLLNPLPVTVRYASALDAVSFQVVDPGEGESAKGDFNRQWGGAVSPLLNWATEYSGND